MHKSKYKKASSIITKRNKARKIYNLSLKIGLPVIFLVGTIFIMRADFLQVKNFEIIGTESILSKNIKNIALNFISGNKFFVIPKSNIFLLDKDKLAAAMLADFGRMEKVGIKKQFLSRSVKLAVEERQADYLWCSKTDECFFMTKEGLIFEKAGYSGSDFLTSSASWAEPKNKMIFWGNLEGDPIMKNFASPDAMQNYLKLVEAFRISKFEIVSIKIESGDKAVAKSNIGDIIFNPEEADLSLIAQNAILLINEIRAKNSSVWFNYIDTRFGNKMFYKLI
jgi:hypothetical protein